MTSAVAAFPDYHVILGPLCALAVIPTFVSVALGGALMLALVCYRVIEPQKWRQ